MPATARPDVPADLVARYNRPGPRYTSYPTAPHFDAAFGADDAAAALRAMSDAPATDLSLYVHLPFCRSLCTYCGCHMMVTHRPEKIAAYVAYVERELALAAEHLGPTRRVVQIHWGGGTPTYLSPDLLRRLMATTRRHFDVAGDAEVSIEADPRELTRAHVDAAREAGFNRMSLGVQDFDPETQAAINRVQPIEQVERATAWAREAGFDGLSYDLIYGLPHQTPERFARTVAETLRLAPDRISLFSYAHVPWLKKHQRLIPDALLPAPEAKLRILLESTDALIDGGYRYIGMDHFARPGDTLTQALDAGTMQRNFQGYSTHAGTTLVGVGVSAISQYPGAYAQNVLGLKDYYAALDAGRLPTARGYALTDDDRLRRSVIMTVMCHGRVRYADLAEHFGIDAPAYFADALAALAPLEADGLVRRDATGFEVTPRGRYFVRNIAMPFDAHLKATPSKPTYSRTI